ncbi:MAG: toprim domain-containing protein [Clostridia bacterium]|nr:toprim domain-containing protein [Clostridia bacterium]
MARDKYTNESISSLKGADRVRKRPGVIFGSDGLEGCEHSVFEILSNSIDEAREGHGNVIKITRFKDNSIEIEDKGRGIPVDFNNKEQKYNWELLFCELYAGGKYNTLNQQSYEYSLGLNGLGLCSTQYASEYMDVEIKRDGFVYKLHFEKGENIGGLQKEEYKRRDTGSKIKWKPDLSVFTDISIPYEYFVDVLKRQAVVNAGIKFVLKYQDETGNREQEFLYQNGISDYVSELLGGEYLTPVQNWSFETKVRDREDKPYYKLKAEIAVAFSNKINLAEYYHNSSFLEHGGAPERAVRSAFTSQVDSYLKQSGKYTKNENKISFSDIEDSLVVIISSFSTVTSYENQTKKSITNKGIQDAITQELKRHLEVYFIENPEDAEKIGNQVLINKRSREDAEKTRLNIKKKLTSTMDMASRVAKFVDCRSKDVSERELFIVEGDSALGACKQARDPNFQAIIPIRGKILNCLKADYNRIFKSEIITDLIRVLGCGVEVRTSKTAKDLSSFNIDLLKWDKVILCTDADVDGFQIRTLLLTMLYRLTPKLIEQGKVFIAESPLYEITTKKETYFAYNESEKEDFIKKIGSEKYTIQRSKGLGENEPDMMNFTTMNPKTRRLIKVMPEEAEKTARMFDVLLGDDLSGRKEYIIENGHLYTENLDIS